MRARGTGCVYQPVKGKNRVWWIAFCDAEGKQRRMSSRSRLQKVAVALLNRKLDEVVTGRFVTGPEVTFDDLARMVVDDYKANDRRSLGTVKNCLAHLREAFGGEARAVGITRAALTRYVAERRGGKPPAAAATIRKELMALRRGFTLAGEGVARVPAFPTVEVRNVRTGFFEEKELRAVLAHLEPEYGAVVEFLSLTGWRRGEALGLTWRQVDFKAGTIRLEPGTTKNDEGRTWPFKALPPLADLLRRQREYTSKVERERGCVIAAVFHRDGRPITDFHDAWERARKAAGLPGRLIHDLRRTAVRNLERAGVSRSVAMKLTGHKTESVYRRYAIVSEADLSEGVGKLAKVHASPAITIQSRSEGEEPSKEGSGEG